jgi:thymidylate synthase (FAD)
MYKSHYSEKFILNHGVVRLLDFMGSDLHIVRAARVSYDAAWRAGENDANDKKLLRRLWRGKPEPRCPTLADLEESGDETAGYTLEHWRPAPLPELPKHSTPFEACTMTFEIMAPIFVFRQWHRHRTQSYNELSARYRELPENCYLPEPSVIGMQDPNNKQGRVYHLDSHMQAARIQETEWVQDHYTACFDLYRKLLKADWPKELARIVLPFGVYSHMFATMNLLNFFKFANLRCDPHAQYEIRVYAEAMLSMVADICPASVELFKEANPT